MTNANKIVFVTGGAGYIGSHVCKVLARGGYTPVTLDNLSRGHKEHVKWGPLEKGDLLDTVWLHHVFKKYKPGAVMHFAGYSSVSESVAHPALYYLNNVQGTLLLLATMIAHEVRQLIFSSSAAVYGHPQYIPIREEETCEPVTPYGRSKSMMEDAIADFAVAYGLRYAALRYFNAAGADLEGELGEWHEPETHAIPLALQAALTGRPFSVYGTDYDTRDGTAVRDYVHVSDLANAHVQALYYLEELGASCTLNIGTGHGTSVKEMLEAVERASGRPVSAVAAPRRMGDPAELVADASRARELIGFRPLYSDIDTIVQSAWQWQQKQPLKAA